VVFIGISWDYDLFKIHLRSVIVAPDAPGLGLASLRQVCADVRQFPSPVQQRIDLLRRT
jgi:hypothetical protein